MAWAAIALESVLHDAHGINRVANWCDSRGRHNSYGDSRMNRERFEPARVQPTSRTVRILRNLVWAAIALVLCGVIVVRFRGFVAKARSVTLEQAVEACDLVRIKRLLDEGADVNTPVKNGYSALEIALDEARGSIWTARRAAIIRLLMDHDLTVRPYTPAGSVAWLAAARYGTADQLRALTNRGVKVNQVAHNRIMGDSTALAEAAQADNVEGVRFLLAHGAMDKDAAIFHTGAQCTLLLLQYGANPNCRDRGGMSPLFVAAIEGDAVRVNTLLDYQADINCKTNNGQTPLSYAIMGYQPEMVRLLIERGANVNGTDAKGRTPLRLAIEMAMQTRTPRFSQAGEHRSRAEAIITILTAARARR